MSIRVEHLTKVYGRQKAVDNISFEVSPGEILGFLGPNGAGKSTTMKIATGYIPPTSGKVSICGYDVEEHSLAARRMIGYLPEHNPLYLDFYVHEYLRFIGSLHGLAGKKLRNAVSEIIGRVGLTREQNKKIGQLSKGYRQRVGLAQALIHEPKVLILDEPTTGLDPNQIIEIRQLIRQASTDKAVIFSTHIMQEVQALCSRVIIINRGVLVADGSVDVLKMSKTQQWEIEIEFESYPDNPDALLAIDSVVSVDTSRLSELILLVRTKIDSDVRGRIFRLAVERGWVIVGMSKKATTLEHVFKELTT